MVTHFLVVAVVVVVAVAAAAVVVVNNEIQLQMTSASQTMFLLLLLLLFVNVAEKLLDSLSSSSSSASAPAVSHQSWLNIADSAHFHISSVRTLAAAVTSSSVLIFSAGGRGQLCAWAADVIGSSCVIGRLQWLASHMHHVTRRRKSTNREQSELQDIRYMKVTTFSANDLEPGLFADLFFLAVACSDGFIRSALNIVVIIFCLKFLNL